MGTHPIFESDFDCLTECFHDYVHERPRASFLRLVSRRPRLKPSDRRKESIAPSNKSTTGTPPTPRPVGRCPPFVGVLVDDPDDVFCLQPHLLLCAYHGLRHVTCPSSLLRNGRTRSGHQRIRGERAPVDFGNGFHSGAEGVSGLSLFLP